MITAKQAEANSQNALLSTGPKTPEGKAAAALNALKHGLLSRDALLPGEDADTLKELREHLQTELQPIGELEALLVDRIAAACWRLRRLGRVEAGIFTWQLYGPLTERAERGVKAYERTEAWDPEFLKAFPKAKPSSRTRRNTKRPWPSSRKSEPNRKRRHRL